MASGHVNRIYRPNTWLHRPSLRREDLSCQPGAVHTWHKADVAGLSAFRRIIMTSGEKIGAALAKALKSAAAEWKKGEQAPVMYRTNLRDVPKVDGLKRDDG